MFMTVPWAVQSGSSPLFDVLGSLARTLCLLSRAPAALRATSQTNTASNRAGLCGEETRHFHLECRTDWPLFCTRPVPAEFPWIAERLWEPFGRNFWGIPPSAPHSLHL